MLHALLEPYGYLLISVGGTKDALYVHESAVQGLMELDLTMALHTFYSCCMAEPNPTNAKQLEVEVNPFNIVFGKYSPSQWHNQSLNQYSSCTQ